jgi:hypothetical protein
MLHTRVVAETKLHVSMHLSKALVRQVKNACICQAVAREVRNACIYEYQNAMHHRDSCQSKPKTLPKVGLVNRNG